MTDASKKILEDAEVGLWRIEIDAKEDLRLLEIERERLMAELARKLAGEKK
ncbi:MAG: hypothetical protein WCJ29_00450 [bacterium]